jgi:2-hydroxycyclohexanecarboxyl-CoA dehydrogenase
MSLNDRVAIITGAARGIGRGTALAMARAGAAVAVVDRDAEGAARTAAELTSIGARSLAVRADVSQLAQVRDAVAETLRAFGTVDVLVNAAQSLPPLLAPVHEQTDEDISTQLASGFWSTFWFMREVFPYMRDKHRGHVINFGSNAGTHGVRNHTGYAAAKEAIRGLSKVAALDWAEYGICVNVICPKAYSPSMVAVFGEEPLARAAEAVPMRRLGDAENDIGRAVVFLASDDSAYVTGQTLHVSGGAIIPQ